MGVGVGVGVSVGVDVGIVMQLDTETGLGLGQYYAGLPVESQSSQLPAEHRRCKAMHPSGRRWE